MKKWYKKNHRTFEWRSSNNPWQILLIETLAQQTQLERANVFYQKFIKKYPTPKDMANDSKKEVLRLWSGLGYNNRAIRLHSTSKILSETGFDELYPNFTVLPGVGVYTNSALLSFAYGEKVVAIDTNIKRIIQRYFKIQGKDIDIFLLENKSLLLNRFDSRDFNQALMDLGATICKSRSPKCDICPLEPKCNKFILENKKKQSKFEGSMRQKRGAILKMLLSDESLTKEKISTELQVSNKALDDILDSLVKDGLIEFSKNKLIVINDN